MPWQLEDALRTIGSDHKSALKRTAARVVLGPSVIRVFVPGTAKSLRKILENINIDILPSFQRADVFKGWFENELRIIAREIKNRNENNDRVFPGYHWGHATKVLTLHLRELVLNSRYFSDRQVNKISNFLYVPIDGIAIKQLKKLGVRLDFDSIKGIDTPQKFYGVQNIIGMAAKAVGVPRIWFDDLWSERN